MSEQEECDYNPVIVVAMGWCAFRLKMSSHANLWLMHLADATPASTKRVAAARCDPELSFSSVGEPKTRHSTSPAEVRAEVLILWGDVGNFIGGRAPRLSAASKKSPVFCAPKRPSRRVPLRSAEKALAAPAAARGLS